MHSVESSRIALFFIFTLIFLPFLFSHLLIDVIRNTLCLVCVLFVSQFKLKSYLLLFYFVAQRYNIWATRLLFLRSNTVNVCVSLSTGHLCVCVCVCVCVRACVCACVRVGVRVVMFSLSSSSFCCTSLVICLSLSLSLSSHSPLLFSSPVNTHPKFICLGPCSTKQFQEKLITATYISAPVFVSFGVLLLVTMDVSMI